MLIEATSAPVLPERDHPTEAPLLHALGSMLRSGTVCAQRAEALLAATKDPTIEKGGRRLLVSRFAGWHSSRRWARLSGGSQTAMLRAKRFPRSRQFRKDRGGWAWCRGAVGDCGRLV